MFYCCRQITLHSLSFYITTILVGIICAAFLGNLIRNYRNNSNLGYIQLRCPPIDPEQQSAIKITIKTPFGTELDMVQDLKGNWGIAGNSKRAVNAISIHSSSINEIATKGWEISITRGLTPSWKPVEIILSNKQRGYFQLPKTRIPGSFLNTYSKAWNWQGDVSLVSYSLLQVGILFLAICYFGLILRSYFTDYFERKRGQQTPLTNPINKTASYLLLSVLTTILTLSCLIFAVHHMQKMRETIWPGLHDDGVYFAPIVVNRAKYQRNEFAVYTPALLKTNGDREVKGHGQFYQAAMSRMLTSPSMEGLLKCLHTVNLVTFLLANVYFCVAFRRGLQLAWIYSACLGSLSAIATVTVMHYLQGRPEHGIPPTLIIIGLVMSSFDRPNVRILLQGIAIGTVASISPYPGGIYGLACVFALCLKEKSTHTVYLACSAMLAISILMWVILTKCAFSGSITELLKNTASAGKTAYFAFSLEAIPQYWWNQPLMPGIGVCFFAAITVAIIATFRSFVSESPTPVKIMLALTGLPLLYVTITNGITYAGFHYSLIGFFPSLLVWLTSSLAPDATPSETSSQLNRKLSSHSHNFAPVIILDSVIVPCYGFIKTALLQNAIIHRGISYMDAEKDISSLTGRLSTEEVVLIESFMGQRSAVVLDKPPWKFLSRPTGSIHDAEKQLGFKVRFYLTLQGSDIPPKIPGFKLIINKFVPDAVVFENFQLCWFTPGYGYAVYEKHPDAN